MSKLLREDLKSLLTKKYFFLSHIALVIFYSYDKKDGGKKCVFSFVCLMGRCSFFLLYNKHAIMS